MWSYYGSKSKLVNLYHEPKHDLIIEPFAGSAKYSYKYWDRDVILVEKNVEVYNLWIWLQSTTKDEVLDIPRFKQGDRVSDFDLTEGQKLLSGFLVGCGLSKTQNVATFRATTHRPNLINSQIERIANDLHKIKHWDIRLGSYEGLENTKSTWFIDPPYMDGGKHYPENVIDYNFLSEWCKSRDGQVIVCENNNADWLPFEYLKQYWGGIKKSKEVIYYQDNGERIEVNKNSQKFW